MKTTLVIVSFNSFKVIERCLGSVIDSGVYPVIIVDNGSPDGSAEGLMARFPGADVVCLERNIGYGRAANRGFARVKTGYALLLNPDIVGTLDKIRLLEQRLSELPDQVVILAPAVSAKHFCEQGLLEKDWVIGAALLLRMQSLKEVGFFDENIFLFSEETDLCLRIKQAGKRILLDSDVYIEHLSKQSSTPSAEVDFLKAWHYAWSNQYLAVKHGFAHGKNNPRRRLLMYWLKFVTATNPEKRQKFKARYLGARAFLAGEGAFLTDGSPQQGHRLG
ncbi:glycosyltransferase family 2 protein [Marinobacter sp.]|uniref:glycosyltransferase family 2 protein n=1 Tax=Marinobacter sp. TaxID=50741 RepID=UPI003A926607